MIQLHQIYTNGDVIITDILYLLPIPLHLQNYPFSETKKQCESVCVCVVTVLLDILEILAST